jgi:hypothetical protein
MHVSRSICAFLVTVYLTGCGTSVATQPTSLSAAMSDIQILRYLKLDPNMMKGKTEYSMDSSRAAYSDGVNEVLIVRSISEVDVSRLKPVELTQYWHLPTT